MSVTVSKSYRSEDTQAYYEQFKETWPTDKCPLCEKSHATVTRGAHLDAIRNDFPYYAYDNKIVTDHLLIVPHEHVLTLAEYTHEASTELLKLMAEFEVHGYSIYMRAPNNGSRSIKHNHIHLLKLGADIN